MKKLGLPLAVLLVAILLFTGTGIAWRRSDLRDEALSDLHNTLEAVQDLEMQADSPLVNRRVLYGEQVQERSQPHYERAIAEVIDWDLEWMLGCVRAGGAEREDLIEAGAIALQELRLGAHASDASWDLAEPVRLIHASKLSELAEAHVSSLLEQGRDEDAAEVLLDLLQFAGDLSQAQLLINGMIGVHLLSPQVLVEMLADGSLESLSPAAREKLTTGLRNLDERVTWEVADLRGEALWVAKGIQRAAHPRMDGTTDLSGLRKGTEALRTLLRARTELQTAFQNGPLSALAMLESSLAEAKELGPDAIQAYITSKVVSAQSGRLHSVGRFRMLVHALAPSRSPQSPQDPWLEAFLREEETGVGTRFWLENNGSTAEFLNVEVLAAR